MLNTTAEEGLSDNTWRLVAGQPIKGDITVTNDQWQRAMRIVVEKPQSVDKRLSGQVTLNQVRLPFNTIAWPKLATQLVFLNTHTWDRVNEEIIRHSIAGTDVTNGASEWLFTLQRMIPKNACKHREYVRLVAVGESSCVFLPVGSSEPHPYLLSCR
jgi:hypothetical protein